MKRFVAVLGLLVALGVLSPVGAAPPLSESDQQRIADGSTDHDGQIDQADGLYVLLRNAGQWAEDDFSGEDGAAVAPVPDYDYLGENPAKVRGNVYLIEGVFEQSARIPVRQTGALTAGDFAWGDKLTRWAIRTSESGDDVVLVFFNDPDQAIPTPEQGTQVRVAARFYKVWDTETAEGEPFSFLTFVGGAYEATGKSPAARFGSSRSMRGIIISLILMSIAAFFVVRLMLNRKAGQGAGGRTHAFLEQRRHERDQQADAEDEVIDDLPDDPAAAMAVLLERHKEED